METWLRLVLLQFLVCCFKAAGGKAVNKNASLVVIEKTPKKLLLLLLLLVQLLRPNGTSRPFSIFPIFSLKKNTCLFCTILGYFDSSTFFFNCVRLILYGIRRDLICLVSTDYSNAMDDFQLFFWRVDYYYQRFSVLIILFCDYFCWVGYLKSPVLVLSLIRFSTSRVNSSSLTILLLTDCSVQDSVHHSRCSEDSLGFWNIINIFKNHNIIVKRRRRSSIWWQMRSFDSDPSRRTNNQSRTFTKDMTGSIFVLSFSLAPFFSVIFHGRRMLADSSGFPFCEFCEICEFSNGFYSI